MEVLTMPEMQNLSRELVNEAPPVSLASRWEVAA